MAQDAPRQSLVARHAASLDLQLPARLVTKEETWSPLLMVLSGGHSGDVNCVAVCGSLAFSASDDESIWWVGAHR